MALNYPQIDPVITSIGPIQLRWYGLMYVIGILGAWMLAIKRTKTQKDIWPPEQIADLVFYIAIGIILGGRIGYLLIYDFAHFAANPLTFIKIWEPGRSFHGGLVGVLLALAIFKWRYQKPYLMVTDFVAPIVPIGLACGRLGNFINGELWGRVTTMPWGMIFPHVDNLPRHPSQIYEFLTEGVLLFIILWRYSRVPRPLGAVSAWFLLLYASFRFIVEFFRVPDVQMGFVAFDWMTMGQLLSIPMFGLGLFLLFRRK